MKLFKCFKQIPYLFEYKSHFFVPENQSKIGGATYTRGYVKWPAKITTNTYEKHAIALFVCFGVDMYLPN